MYQQPFAEVSFAISWNYAAHGWLNVVWNSVTDIRKSIIHQKLFRTLTEKQHFQRKSKYTRKVWILKWVVYNMGALKYFAPPPPPPPRPPRYIYWSKGIETSWNYIKSLCIIFIPNWFKYFDQKNQSQSSVPKCFNTPILHTTNADFYSRPVKTGSIFFFSSSDMQKFHHLLGYRAIGINSSVITF